MKKSNGLLTGICVIATLAVSAWFIGGMWVWKQALTNPRMYDAAVKGGVKMMVAPHK